MPRIKVKSVYLDCTSPAAPSGFIEEAEWDTEHAALYVRLPAKNVVVPLSHVRELEVAPVPALKPEPYRPASAEAQREIDAMHVADSRRSKKK